MKILSTRFAGQSIISWCLQLVFIYLAWRVVDHRIPNDTSTIVGAAVLMLLIYLSLSRDSKNK
ncbi:Uncharacterized protein LACOL_0261 [Paucilactobacillus oligofermentans DSM 15707 = LMG 22743]|uniref:hypothetical protein n=1 Tax=Paucilactobacillus oligofermentans TaxID=293371 RepID=UPI00070F82A7|nr:hypothetical protein [Paucilactobacillus oligofermentans]CUS25569.1 Uncharacterized protein LACOL_0261 [Paucilactobacillus oligofermentans DSM 15707 = LMG 22743]